MSLIDKSRNFLVLLPDLCGGDDKAYQELIHNFCGHITSPQNLPHDQGELNIYLCGDLDQWPEDVEPPLCPRIIREFSVGHWEHPNDLVTLGQVPILIHGVGVYFKQFFPQQLDLFNTIKTAHTFQSLTESNKTAQALRKGIYLTPVRVIDDELHFQLLRCSSNLSGPTENFREIDKMIVDSLNRYAQEVFQDPSPLNHVLAQIYENHQTNGRDNKARIKAHSDKTKDMPEHGLIAFCTFYDEITQLERHGFDYRFRETSGLTRLHFRLKSDVKSDDHFCRDFYVTLYPNSVFLIPLSTNRYYTHEICPSSLNIPRIPTRMGYVVRCSNTFAVHQDGQTYLLDPQPDPQPDQRLPLVPGTTDSMETLRELYRQENMTSIVVKYGLVNFSMNQGDYLAPIP